jgi:hypothetical protein
MYQCSSHWMDFLKLDTGGMLWKSVEKLQIWLISNKNIGHFTWRPVCYMLLAGTYIVQQYRECLLCFHGKVFNIYYFAESDMYVNNANGMHCCTSMSSVVTQIFQHFTLYCIVYLVWAPCLSLCKTLFFSLRYFEGLWSRFFIYRELPVTASGGIAICFFNCCNTNYAMKNGRSLSRVWSVVHSRTSVVSALRVLN